VLCVVTIARARAYRLQPLGLRACWSQTGRTQLSCRWTSPGTGRAAMSEYQYYEFLAVDRPPTVAEQAEVRELSTRARITSTSFTNEYHWGTSGVIPMR
jgi:hypothetical protein